MREYPQPTFLWWAAGRPGSARRWGGPARRKDAAARKPGLLRRDRLLLPGHAHEPDAPGRPAARSQVHELLIGKLLGYGDRAGASGGTRCGATSSTSRSRFSTRWMRAG